MKLRQAVIIAAIEPFISAAPRRNNKPSLMVGRKGSVFHDAELPAGTTSVWPARHKTGHEGLRVVQILVTVTIGIFSTVNPSVFNSAINSSWQPSSAGLTEGRAIRALQSWRVEVIQDQLFACSWALSSISLLLVRHS